MFTSVLLPEPFSPSSASISPLLTSMETFLFACTVPKLLQMFFNLIYGSDISTSRKLNSEFGILNSELMYPAPPDNFDPVCFHKRYAAAYRS